VGAQGCCQEVDNLLLVAPDHGQETVLGGEAVDRVIGLGLGTDVAREGVGGEGAVVAAVLVNTSDVDLDGSVVLGANEAVSGGAIGS
jgi:hypothetical protein